MADPQVAKIVQFPDLKPATRRQLLGGELGSQFDVYDHVYGAWGSGDVLDVSDWNDRDMAVMLRRDGQAAALEAVLTLPIRQASRAIEKGEGDKGEAEFCRSVLMAPHTSGGMKTPIQDVIGQLTSAQIYKKCFMEKVWDVRPDDGRIVYDKLAYRPSATCELKRNAETGAMDGFRQMRYILGGQIKASRKDKLPGWVDIPAVRSFVYINGKHRSPLIGTSELDLSYTAYKTKLKILYLWNVFLENQALPKVVVYGQSQEQANDRADDVASMRASGIVGFQTLPNSEKSFDILASDGKGASSFQDALTFLETWQTSSVLAGFMGLSSLASLGRGSLALSQDQSAFFLKSRQAVTAEMEASLTHDVLAPLVTLNFGPGASYPTFRFGALTDESGSALVTLFQAMAVAPSLQVPTGILDIITERLAAYLNLDESAVAAIVQEGAKEREAQATATAPPGVPPKVAGGIGAMAGGLNAATRIYQKALKDAGSAAQPENIAQPFSAAPISAGAPKG